MPLSKSTSTSLSCGDAEEDGRDERQILLRMFTLSASCYSKVQRKVSQCKERRLRACYAATHQQTPSSSSSSSPQVMTTTPATVATDSSSSSSLVSTRIMEAPLKAFDSSDLTDGLLSRCGNEEDSNSTAPSAPAFPDTTSDSVLVDGTTPRRTVQKAAQPASTSWQNAHMRRPSANLKTANRVNVRRTLSTLEQQRFHTASTSTLTSNVTSTPTAALPPLSSLPLHASGSSSDGAETRETSTITTPSSISPSAAQQGEVLLPSLEVAATSDAVAGREPHFQSPRDGLTHTFSAFVERLTGHSTSASPQLQPLLPEIAHGTGLPDLHRTPGALDPPPPPYGELMTTQKRQWLPGSFHSRQDLLAHIRFFEPWTVVACHCWRRGSAPSDLTLQTEQKTRLSCPSGSPTTGDADTVSASLVPQLLESGRAPRCCCSLPSSPSTTTAAADDGKTLTETAMASDRVDAVLPSWSYATSHVADAPSCPCGCVSRSCGIFPSTLAEHWTFSRLWRDAGAMGQSTVAAAVAQTRLVKEKSLRYVRVQLRATVVEDTHVVAPSASAEARQVRLRQMVHEFEETSVLGTSVLRGLLNDAAMQLFCYAEPSVLVDAAGLQSENSTATLDESSCLHSSGKTAVDEGAATPVAGEADISTVPLSLNICTTHRKVEGNASSPTSPSRTQSCRSAHRSRLSCLDRARSSPEVQVEVKLLVHFTTSALMPNDREAAERQPHAIDAAAAAMMIYVALRKVLYLPLLLSGQTTGLSISNDLTDMLEEATGSVPVGESKDGRPASGDASMAPLRWTAVPVDAVRRLGGLPPLPAQPCVPSQRPESEVEGASRESPLDGALTPQSPTRETGLAETVIGGGTAASPQMDSGVPDGIEEELGAGPKEKAVVAQEDGLERETVDAAELTAPLLEAVRDAFAAMRAICSHCAAIQSSVEAEEKKWSAVKLSTFPHQEYKTLLMHDTVAVLLHSFMATSISADCWNASTGSSSSLVSQPTPEVEPTAATELRRVRKAYSDWWREAVVAPLEAVELFMTTNTSVTVESIRGGAAAKDKTTNSSSLPSSQVLRTDGSRLPVVGGQVVVKGCRRSNRKDKRAATVDTAQVPFASLRSAAEALLPALGLAHEGQRRLLIAAADAAHPQSDSETWDITTTTATAGRVVMVGSPAVIRDFRQRVAAIAVAGQTFGADITNEMARWAELQKCFKGKEAWWREWIASCVACRSTFTTEGVRREALLGGCLKAGQKLVLRIERAAAVSSSEPRIDDAPEVEAVSASDSSLPCDGAAYATLHTFAASCVSGVASATAPVLSKSSLPVLHTRGGSAVEGEGEGDEGCSSSSDQSYDTSNLQRRLRNGVVLGPHSRQISSLTIVSDGVAPGVAVAASSALAMPLMSSSSASSQSGTATVSSNTALSSTATSPRPTRGHAAAATVGLQKPPLHTMAKQRSANAVGGSHRSNSGLTDAVIQGVNRSGSLQRDPSRVEGLMSPTTRASGETPTQLRKSTSASTLWLQGSRMEGAEASPDSSGQFPVSRRRGTASDGARAAVARKPLEGLGADVALLQQAMPFAVIGAVFLILLFFL